MQCHIFALLKERISLHRIACTPGGHLWRIIGSRKVQPPWYWLHFGCDGSQLLTEGHE